LIQKLTSVRRQRFDIATLAFGIDRVECQGRFAGAGKAGDYGQFVSRISTSMFLSVLARPRTVMRSIAITLETERCDTESEFRVGVEPVILADGFHMRQALNQCLDTQGHET